MTPEYRQAQLQLARAEYAKARTLHNATVSDPKHRKESRRAAADLEFWANKIAFLENAR